MCDDDEPIPFGLYECDMCGACCKGNLIVDADYLDVRREPRLLLRQADGGCVSQQALEEEDKRVLLACGLDKPCPFLSPDNDCTIYPTRPNACVAFEPGSKSCQQARSAHGLPALLPVLPVLGSSNESSSVCAG